MKSPPKPIWALLLALGGGMIGYWMGVSTRSEPKDSSSGVIDGKVGSPQLPGSISGSPLREAGAAAGGEQRVDSHSREQAQGDSGGFKDPRLLPKNAGMLRHEALINIWMNKKEGINALGLDPIRRAKLIDILVEQYEAQQDAFDVLGKTGPVTDGSAGKVFSSVNGDYEKQLVDFLGQAEFDKLQSVSQEANRESGVKLFVGTEMEAAEVPLSPEQLAAITAIDPFGPDLVQGGVRGSDGLTEVDHERLAKAALILSAQQLAIYKQGLVDREESTNGH